MSELPQGKILDPRVDEQRGPCWKEFAMGKLTTLPTGRASLCALGEYLRRRCFFLPLMEQVTIAQKVVTYRPVENLLEGLLGMRCGAKTIAPRHGPSNGDRAVQRAVGRKGGAAPSTLARTLHACTAEHVAHLERGSWDDVTRDGATPRHAFPARRWWVEADVTPLPSGATAEGRERAWMGRHRRKTGRTTRRRRASDDRESLPEPLRRGTVSAVPALKAALVDLEARMGGTRELRPRLGIRRDGGCGTTAGLTGWRSRGLSGRGHDPPARARAHVAPGGRALAAPLQ